MSCKKIKIKEMVIKSLGSYQSPASGEYEMDCDVEFILKSEDACNFDVFGRQYKIDRIKMQDYYGDSLTLMLANKNMVFHDFCVPKNYINGVLAMLLKEERKGHRLEKWCFSEEIMDCLKSGDDLRHPFSF